MKIISDNNTILGLPPVREPATGHVAPPSLQTFCVATPASQCTRDQLLDIAADAAQYGSWELAGSRDHIEAICRDYSERMAGELHTALEECVRLRSILARQSAQQARDAHLWLAFEAMTLRLTGETCAQVMARMTQEDVEERTRMAVELAERGAVERFERASTGVQAYSKMQYIDEPDTVVVEVP
jgi:hypothetical protein